MARTLVVLFTIILAAGMRMPAQQFPPGFVDPAPFLPLVGTSDFGTALDGLLASLQEAAGHALDDDLALLLACYDPEGTT